MGTRVRRLEQGESEGRPSWLIWLPIVVMNVFVAILIPLGRYSVPILPLLMILAAFGVDTLFETDAMRSACRSERYFARRDAKGEVVAA